MVRMEGRRERGSEGVGEGNGGRGVEEEGGRRIGREEEGGRKREGGGGTNRGLDKRARMSSDGALPPSSYALFQLPYSPILGDDGPDLLPYSIPSPSLFHPLFSASLQRRRDGDTV
jgi:hypothetical protein